MSFKSHLKQGQELLFSSESVIEIPCELITESVSGNNNDR